MSQQFQLLLLVMLKFHLVFFLLRLHPIHYPILVVDPINIPLLTTFVVGIITVSTPMVVIPPLNDWVITTIVSCLQVSIIAIFDTIGGVVLTRGWWRSILWLPIGIFCGVECGCEYTFGSLLLVWIDGWICQLCNPNWFPNSMLFNLF